MACEGKGVPLSRRQANVKHRTTGRGVSSHLTLRSRQVRQQSARMGAVRRRFVGGDSEPDEAEGAAAAALAVALADARAAGPSASRAAGGSMYGEGEGEGPGEGGGEERHEEGSRAALGDGARGDRRRLQRRHELQVR